jgi:hypothetical protein
MKLARALASGVAGAVAVSAFEALEARALGRPPVYAARAIARRLALRAGVPIDRRRARHLGLALRLTYAAALGVVRARLAPSRRPAALVAFAAAIYALELVALPASGGTPPLRAWRRGETLLLGPHALAFACGAALAGP